MKKLRIAYRRLSGPIGLSVEEEGTRGLWYEKRLALVASLKARGHEVDYCNRATKATGRMFPLNYPYDKHDVLIVEFGSTNARFYGRDLQETAEMVDGHEGRLLFVCDDPDLDLPDFLQHRAWTYLVNCRKPEVFGHFGHVKAAIDMPFGVNANADAATEEGLAGMLAYVGRPNGRLRSIEALTGWKIEFQPYGNEDEWEPYGFFAKPAPRQVDRRDFYRRQLACLALADAKHKVMGWRTGRAFHAMLAGCPVIAEKGHPGLQGFRQCKGEDQVREALAEFRTMVGRKAEIERLHREVLQPARAQLERAFDQAGL